MWAGNPRVKAFYAFAGHRGGCAIVEADSAGGFVDYEVYALITAQEAMASSAEMEKMLAQAAPAS